MKFVVAAGAVAILAGSAAAIDTLTAVQSALGPFATQDTQSSFGGGNVLARAYASVGGGNLNLLATGRIGTGHERLVVFVDNLQGGGATTLPGGLFGIGGAGGLVFDTGFAPQTAIVANGNASELFVDFNGNIGGTPTSVFAGLGPRGNGGAPLMFGGMGAPDIRASFNDSFGGGVFGFGLLSAMEQGTYNGATTGMGLQIPLAAIGVNPGSSFCLMVAILGGDGSTISTQLLAPVGGFGGPITGGGGMFSNYPSAGQVDLNLVPGNQFFHIPGPGALALLGLGVLAGARRRR